jgi:hypothetical protein
VVGSGRCGGVPVEGGSGGVAAASGAVQRLEVEARGELWALCQSRKKSTTWGGPAGGGRQHPFKGQQPVVVAGTQWRGSGEVGRRVEGHEEGGPGSHQWGTARAMWQRPTAKEMEWAELRENAKCARTG